MRKHAGTALLLSLLLPTPTRAAAQSAPPATSSIRAAARTAASRAALSRSISLSQSQPARRAQSNDTLVNGAVIGALVGAAALGGIAGAICAAEHEPGTRSCWGDTFRIAAIGAAIGAGTGVAIDAAATRQRGVRMALRVRF
jgi:hypothetical protein